MDTDDEEIDTGDFAVFPGGTLEEAQAFVQQNLAKGSRCACCGQRHTGVKFNAMLRLK